MNHTCNRKWAVLRAADLVRHARVYVPTSKEYVAGIASRPVKMTKYESSLEPVVDTRGLATLDTSSAWLTVNHYNAVVLNSRNLLIADVDIGDERLNEYAGASDEDEVIDSLRSLQRLEDAYPHLGLRLADDSYRVYRTRHGCRVICTSRCHPHDSHASELLMRFLKTDRRYVALCRIQESYRARLSPKPWRCCDGEPTHVCELIAEIGPKTVHPGLSEQLAIHDELTLPASGVYSVLA